MYVRSSLQDSTQQDHAVPERFLGHGLVGEVAGQGGATLLVPASEAAVRVWAADRSPDLVAVQQSIHTIFEVLQVRDADCVSLAAQSALESLELPAQFVSNLWTGIQLSPGWQSVHLAVDQRDTRV